MVADDKLVYARGQLTLPMQLRDSRTGATFTRPIHFIVLEKSSSPIICGIDLMRLFYCSLDLDSSTLVFRPTLTPDGEVTDRPLEPVAESFVAVRETVHIHAHAMHPVRVRLESESLNHARDFLIEPMKVFNKNRVQVEIRFPPSLHPGRSRRPDNYSIMVENDSMHALTLHAGTRIGVASLIGTQRAPRAVSSVSAAVGMHRADQAEDALEDASERARVAAASAAARAAEDAKCGFTDEQLEASRLFWESRAQADAECGCDSCESA